MPCLDSRLRGNDAFFDGFPESVVPREGGRFTTIQAAFTRMS
jgi:hypothetical protein